MTLKAPATLSPEARRLWRELHAEHAATGAAAARIIDAACHAFDTLRQAEKALRDEGLIVGGRYKGSRVANPAADIAHKARHQFLAALGRLAAMPGATAKPATRTPKRQAEHEKRVAAREQRDAWAAKVAEIRGRLGRTA
jgi:P27 family predicted phage terminase small subunit